MRVKCKMLNLFAQQSASFEVDYKTINEHFLCLHFLLKQNRKLQGGKLKSLYTSLVVVNGRASKSESAPKLGRRRRKLLGG